LDPWPAGVIAEVLLELALEQLRLRESCRHRLLEKLEAARAPRPLRCYRTGWCPQVGPPLAIATEVIEQGEKALVVCPLG
jgi:hypothetical protein